MQPYSQGSLFYSLIPSLWYNLSTVASGGCQGFNPVRAGSFNLMLRRLRLKLTLFQEGRIYENELRCAGLTACQTDYSYFISSPRIVPSTAKRLNVNSGQCMVGSIKGNQSSAACVLIKNQDVGCKRTSVVVGTTYCCMLVVVALCDLACCTRGWSNSLVVAFL
jgi:hypothetical protein